MSSAAPEIGLAVAATATASTENGRRWLMKALDPVNQRFDVAGLPSPNNDQIATLSFVSSFDLGPPNPAISMIGPYRDADSFDGVLHMFQDPILFGCSVTGPAGSQPVTGYSNLTISLHRAGVTNRVRIAIPQGEAVWTPKRYLNSQISGDTYGGKATSLRNQCQAFRMLYGCSQGIPTCSTMYNQGYIEATQQTFTPRVGAAVDSTAAQPAGSWLSDDAKEVLYENNFFDTQAYTAEDFPTSENILANPKSVSFQFNQGIFTPYQLGNVKVNDFRPADVYRFPRMTEYWIVGVQFNATGGVGLSDAMLTTTDAENDSGSICWDCNFIAPAAPNPKQMLPVYFICLSKEGMVFAIRMQVDLLNPGQTDYVDNNNIYYLRGGLNGMQTERQLSTDTQPLQRVIPGWVPNNDYISNKKVSGYINAPLPEDRRYRFQAWACSGYLNVPTGAVSGNTPTSPFIIYNEASNVEGKLLAARLNGAERIAVNIFKSVSKTATMKLIFRIGFEYLLTSGSPYSVIKRISPPMDELALNSYIRASRKMKDAFEAYYASDEGHGDYLTFLAALLQDAADQAGIGPFMNMGGTSGSTRRRR